MRKPSSAPSFMLACAALALLAGCKKQTDEAAPAPAASPSATTAAASASATSDGEQSASAAAVSSEGVAIAETTDLFEFEYSYPGEAAAIPALRDWLEADKARSRREVRDGAREDRAARGPNDSYIPHTMAIKWEKVAQISGFLSLSAGTDMFTGGAHGMQGFDSLIWDGRAGRRIQPSEMFDDAALDRAIRAPFCDALDKERSKRREMPVNRDSGDAFDACIAPLENTLILGSSDGKTFNRIGVLVGPYAAGSYAEGTYEITLPVTGAVMRAVKPQYRSAFAPQ